jgi:hypothetical protein
MINKKGRPFKNFEPSESNMTPVQLIPSSSSSPKLSYGYLNEHHPRMLGYKPVYIREKADRI